MSRVQKLFRCLRFHFGCVSESAIPAFEFSLNKVWILWEAILEPWEWREKVYGGAVVRLHSVSTPTVQGYTAALAQIHTVFNS